MKKKKLILAFVIVSGFFAQTAPVSASQNFNKGDFFIGPSVGASLFTLPLALNAEYAVAKNIGIGASIGYVGFGFGLLSYSAIPIAITGMYHFDLPDIPQWDLGLGIAIGYTLFTGTFSGWGGPAWLNWGIYGNARYFISPKIALKGRLGYGVISLIEVGVDFKL